MFWVERVAYIFFRTAGSSLLTYLPLVTGRTCAGLAPQRRAGPAAAPGRGSGGAVGTSRGAEGPAVSGGSPRCREWGVLGRRGSHLCSVSLLQPEEPVEAGQPRRGAPEDAAGLREGLAPGAGASSGSDPAWIR